MITVALLTGGKDPQYARGLVRQLTAKGVHVVLVGSREEMIGAEEIGSGRVDLHDLVGRFDQHAGITAKVRRVVAYYARLARFVARTDATLFHVLWFRKFPQVEWTLLTIYLRLLGKKLVFTAHNIDDQTRDGRAGSLTHRWSLGFFYGAADHIFVHTRKMRQELVERFRVADLRVTVVPLAINDVTPVWSITRPEARQRLALEPDKRLLLLFGNIAPYKGVEDAVRALARLAREDARFTLVIAGPVKNPACRGYWRQVEELIVELGVGDHVRKEVRYIPEDEVGLVFRAADVPLLTYRRVYESGVLTLSYAQGLPVIAADVGSMSEDVRVGETGFLFAPGDPADLAARFRPTSRATCSASSRSGARRSLTTAPSSSRGKPTPSARARSTRRCCDEPWRGQPYAPRAHFPWRN